MIKEGKGKRQIESDRKGTSLDVVAALINSEEAEEAVTLFRSGGFFCICLALLCIIVNSHRKDG